MKFAPHIKYEIKNRVKESYSDWTIGVTHDPGRRLMDQGNPPFWISWEANDITVAMEVINYFLNEFPPDQALRMKMGAKEALDEKKTPFIYIF